MNDLAKLDVALFRALQAWEADPAATEDDGSSVILRFEGDIGSIQALGFEIIEVFEDEAMGIIRFRDVAEIVAHPAVLSIAAGSPPRACLDVAASDIRARASTKDNIDKDGLWFLAPDAGEFHALPDATGAGVIVAILDSGIDYTHPMFRHPVTKKTRILRIWDQGLPPSKPADCPAGVLMVHPAKRYGVEFQREAIDAALAGGTPLAHRDCLGHGTFVAGIAAGGRWIPRGHNALLSGIAPEADIIAVKMLDVPETIRYFGPNGFGEKAEWIPRFRDAVTYCLRVAREIDKPPDQRNQRPVVLNMSFGWDGNPGDGLDENAVWVDSVLRPNGPHAAGAIVVKSGGNEGDASTRRTAKITVPQQGSVEVPLTLVDDRGGFQVRRINCKEIVYKPDVDVHFWYRDTGQVQFALRLPGQSDFDLNVGAGQFVERFFRHHAGPPASVTFANDSPTVHRALVWHEKIPGVRPNAGSIIRRNHVTLSIRPSATADTIPTISYPTGTYTVRITAPQGTEVFVVCSPESWGGLQVSFELAPGVAVTSESTMTDTLGRHAITVAAYDAETHEIADYSSRGPLRDFSGGAVPPIAAKPDLAAPGVRIRTARSVHTPTKLFRGWADMGDGTSAATPFVTGVVALLLDKNPNLKTEDARKALLDGAKERPGNNHTAETFGSGMLNALKSHQSI